MERCQPGALTRPEMSFFGLIRGVCVQVQLAIGLEAGVFMKHRCRIFTCVLMIMQQSTVFLLPVHRCVLRGIAC